MCYNRVIKIKIEFTKGDKKMKTITQLEKELSQIRKLRKEGKLESGDYGFK